MDQYQDMEMQEAPEETDSPQEKEDLSENMPEPKKSKWWIWALLLILIFGGGAYYYYYYFYMM